MPARACERTDVNLLEWFQRERRMFTLRSGNVAEPVPANRDELAHDEPPASVREDQKNGLALMYLLTTTPHWVHRRVDALRLDAKGSTRRYVSVDVTVPPVAALPAASRNRIIVPLGWMHKGPITRLDAKQDGNGLAVLSKVENTAWAFEMLKAALSSVPRRREVTHEDHACLMTLLTSDAETDQTALEAYVSMRDSLVDEAAFNEESRRRIVLLDGFAKLLVDNYLFLVELDKDLAGIRTTLKYSLDVPSVLTRSGPIRLHWPVPDFRFAASQHVEVDLPQGLRVQKMQFAAFNVDNTSTQMHEEMPTGDSGSVHGVLRPDDGDVKADLIVRAQPVRQGLYTFTQGAVAITAALVLASILARIFDAALLNDAVIPSPAASIILIAPALLLSWMSRELEHDLLSKLLSPMRRILILCAGVVLLMAGLAAVPVSVGLWHCLWGVVYLGMLGIVIYALVVFNGYRKMSEPSRRVQPNTTDAGEGDTHAMVQQAA